MKLLLFDLDGTLLRSDKTISKYTMSVLQKCKEKGVLIGISTSRAEQNCLSFLPKLKPDILIASGGAVIKNRESYIYTAEFSVEETRKMIECARKVCGDDCEMTVDTLTSHFWNYKEDPNKNDATWGETIYTDFIDYSKKALKFCVEIFDPLLADKLSSCFSDCDCHRFSGSAWYKFTKKDATKENAILKICDYCNIDLKDITAFGDDSPDIEMLKLCGTGVAMGNAIDSVKEAADVVIESNDEDGIAKYLEKYYL